MSFCIVNGCKNRSKKKNYEQIAYESLNKKISFHKLPKCENRKKKWLETLRLNQCYVPSLAAVCSAHFKPDDFESGISISRLKKDSVPYLTEKEKLIILNEADCQRIKQFKVDMDNHSAVDMDNQPVVERQEELSAVNMQSIENTCNHVNTEKRFMDSSTSISPTTRFQSPTKEWMRKVHAKEMTALKRKLYVTTHKKKLLENKLVSLKQLLKTLRSKQLISKTDFNNLEHLDTDIVYITIDRQ
ncbi:hypothetical protein ABEB36_008731 [Hypothenemus hampei]|uniref:THAP-type domain-containing protein n=1 Tax=Hypothenemus hampei TaxID=57062 RepID=A0ABD1EMW3_HYPHA